MCVPQLNYDEKLTPRMRNSCSTPVRARELDDDHANTHKSFGALQNPTRIAIAASTRVPAPTSICAVLVENAWSQNGAKC